MGYGPDGVNNNLQHLTIIIPRAIRGHELHKTASAPDVLGTDQGHEA